jgi:hypothetical protein
MWSSSAVTVNVSLFPISYTFFPMSNFKSMDVSMPSAKHACQVDTVLQVRTVQTVLFKAKVQHISKFTEPFFEIWTFF